MERIKITVNVKKTALTPAGTDVLTWLNTNTGDFPGSIQLKKAASGIMAMLDGKAIGIVQTNDGKPYNGSDFTFDDKGECTDTYTFVITGLSVVDTKKQTMVGVIEKDVVKKVSTSACDSSAFDAEVQRIVAEGICSEELVRENIGIMLQNNVSPKVIRAVLNRYEHVENPATTKTTYVSVNNDGYMQLALINALEGHGSIFQGGQSVGKNVLAMTIAKVLHVPFFLITMSADMTPDDIYGGKSTDNSAANNLSLALAEKVENGDAQARVKWTYYSTLAGSVRIVLDESEIINGLTAKRSIICLNEMNMGDANLLASFANQILDGTGFVFVPGRGRIAVNPNCVLIGTQNPGYTGTMEQNQATLSRFAVIDMGFPSEVISPLKAALKDIADDIPTVVLDKVNKLYLECLNASKSGEISDACLNIRGYARAIRNHVLWDADLRNQIMVQVVNACKAEDRAVVGQKVSLFFE